MMNYNSKHQVKVGGKMSAKDAGLVGKIFAISALILAVGFAACAVMIGLSYLI